MTAVGIFLLFGVVMASLAGTTLLFPGTALDRIWWLNPRAYKELAPFAKAAGLGFVLLGCTLALATFGWFQRRLWGWRLAVVLIATQVAGDLFNLFRGRALEGIVGITVAGALFCYLLSRRVRAEFEAMT
jgi:hypothetical protein